MKASEIRAIFLDYYIGKGHTAVPSASLVPSSYDPSVLLTTAGMQPFKPYFLGLEQPPSNRLTSCQKCFRTPDIDQVGLTARHLTFFEMLGNFSLGDYFKQGAIEMAWDILSEGLGLDPARLWTTVHAGDPALGLGLDEEAVELWMQAGVPRDRIVALGEDNFWKAGPTGPCGPCSEIYFDRGPEHQQGCPDPAACQPGCECDRYLEFYNLVFMQYDRDDAGVLTPLPKQNIDTGMGLERIASLLQDNVSVFEIDSFREIIGWAERHSGRRYGEDPVATKALRVLADHGRGMTFLASDGVMPSNEGRGYVLRRIIRRAIQQADRIGLYADGATGVLEQLSSQVTDLFADHYPELAAQRTTVVDLLAAEEERFLRTLARGTALLREVIDAAPGDGGVVAGDDAFRLHDTFGFPIELTEELAREASRSVDRPRFEELMRAQRDRARAAAGGGSLPVEAAAAFVREAPASAFVGYTETTVETVVAAVRAIDGFGEGTVLLKLAHTPFYAEGGGQVADGGTITAPRGHAVVRTVMRFEHDQVIVATLDGELAAGDPVRAVVDAEQRIPTQLNHTATHLLHRALRSRLGDHVRQAGSLVAPDRLRFDFTHPHALSPDDIAAIEQEANRQIALAVPVSWREMSIDQAREAGAMMLFGEKYGDTVRMVEVGDGYSRELCGGTHVANTASIQLLLVTSEASVGANTRRIEALTGPAAIEHLRHRAMVAERSAAEAGTDVDRLPDRVSELVRRTRQLERELTTLRSGADLDSALASAQRVGELNTVVYRADGLDADELLELGDRLKDKLAPAAVVLGSVRDGKVVLIATAGEDAVGLGFDAHRIIREVSGIVGGGGGGRPTMARAGGKLPDRLDEALDAARSAIGAAIEAGAAR